jgi:hypothetical protein
VKLRHGVIQVALAATLLSLSFPAEAQQTAKVPRIGVLEARGPSDRAQVLAAFREGLRDLTGWTASCSGGFHEGRGY